MLSPSDRLRTYIGLLAVIDLFVIVSLVVRLIYVFLPEATTADLNCQIIFGVDRLVKLASLLCLACISVERLISIRKPFNNHVRKRFVQLTPLIALGVLAVVVSAVTLLTLGVHANSSATDCVVEMDGESLLLVARWVVAAAFMLLLLVITSNYAQIVRHVRKKFWERKTRAIVANARSRLPLIAEPRYMRRMTSAIVRIACFHFACWLPSCVLQLLPDWTDQLASLRLLAEPADFSVWITLIANWLIYVNAALDWVLYAALNRDLRSIIRATTERRKRSTMSHSSPSSNLQRSIRKHVTQSLRFFYSINSYRSNGSFDDSMTGQPNGSVDSGSPATVARSISNAGGAASEGLFGMRNGRAHTFCSPRSSTVPGRRPVAPRPVLAAIFGSHQPAKRQLERFI